MQSIDLNLLVALDALLSEGSVAGAAKRLNLSAPAVSRTLARARLTLGDELLVRAGRRMVPTPRALELRGRVRDLLEEVQSVLRPEGAANPMALTRNFTIRSSDYVAGVFGPVLHEIAVEEAPQVVLRFTEQGKEDVGALREGRIDLEVGVLGETGPEISTQVLTRDRFVGVAREGHLALKDKMTVERFAAARHISASRRGRTEGPIDQALAELGLSRQVRFVVPGFYVALLVAASSDMIAAVPLSIAKTAKRRGLAIAHFSLPVDTPEVVIAQAWHPRFDKDAGHRWLRQAMRRALTGGFQEPKTLNQNKTLNQKVK
jgi:DNA-binding transcriptional LysR family regulator